MTHDAFHVLCTEAGRAHLAVRVSLIPEPSGPSLLRIELWDGTTKLTQATPVPAGRDIDVQARGLLGQLRRHLGSEEAA